MQQKVVEYRLKMLDTKTKSENLIIEQVSHDLRGIIIKINQLNEMLHDKMQNNCDVETQQILSHIDKLCEQGNQITQDLLDSCELESLEDNQLELRSINQLVEQQSKIYALQVLKKQIRFRFIIPDKQFFCKLNYSKFIRVLDNLFSNALKFTEVYGEIKITLINIDDKVIISIGDNGIGIPDELHKEIFKKYTKASRCGTKNENSTGLGLYIVKKIVDLHKGKVWFETKENQGTIFYIELAYEIV